MSADTERTIVVSLPTNASRRDLRLVCARIHDVAAVSAVEVSADASSLRVTGRMSVDDLRAAAAAAAASLG